MESIQKNGLRTFFRRMFFKHCPPSLLQKVIREMISLDSTPDPDLVIKIAETKEELEGAFQVLYRAYLEMGYCEETESKMRLTIHHALPTTAVIIAKYKDKVVGTLSLVRDNNLNLPCEKDWNIEFLRTHHRRVAEITSLAVDREFRRAKKGNIFFPLLKFMYEFATDYFGTRILSIVVHPKELDFYEGLFFFRPIDKKILQDYYGAPAIALYLDLVEAKNRYRKVYGKKPHHKNIYRYFTEVKSPCLVMPVKTHFSVDYPVLNKSLFRYFFYEVSNIGESVDADTLDKIMRHYPGDDEGRIASRFDVDLTAHIVNAETDSVHAVRITNISSSGLRLVCDESDPGNIFEPHKNYELRFEPDTQLQAMVIACQWKRAGNVGGFRVSTNQLSWYHFLKQVHRNYAPSDDIHFVFSEERLKKTA